MNLIPIKEREINDGQQKIYKFDNGYGASVVQHSFSYGHEQGLWELAVIKFEGDGMDDWSLCYSTPITSDVIGHLTLEEVEEILKKIKKLKKEKTE